MEREYKRPMTRAAGFWSLLLLILALTCACGGNDGNDAPARQAARAEPRLSILLITMDTTRADAIGPDAVGIETPAFNALAARGRRFRQAYSTVPETLPSHSSMMTGLYPAGHGVHENARYLPQSHPVLAERLRQAGYRTGAFVSSFVLSRRFGLARGFDVYDDEMAAGGVERASRDTTNRALAFLDGIRAGDQPIFAWVHYFDAHAPYTPPEPFLSRFKGQPYLGEVAAMDQEIGRLVQGFEQRVKRPIAIVAVSDHGEGLGDHGELQHGNLLYQSTMHVPLAVVGPGIEPGVSDAPVSTRRVFHTVLDWAGLGNENSLRANANSSEVVLGEAMKPFLEYGWQPQIMAVHGAQKAILAGITETYDLRADPKEATNLGAGANLATPLRKALDDYPVPSPERARPPDNLTDEAKRSLASLGYVSASATPIVRNDAPRPADMTRLFEVLEKASGLFVREQYAAAIPLLKQILAEDPYNLDAMLRLATSYSSLGQDALAVETFRKAAAIAPHSPDVGLYLALHYARSKNWEPAVPLLERIVAETPERLPALEALATIRERQGRPADALDLRQKIAALRTPSAAELIHVGGLAMSDQRTDEAIDAYERARAQQGSAFTHDLELGVLYLAARRFEQARDALDRVPPTNREYPMALFKRAQVSVLLKEPDSGTRIETARKHADATTRELIARERLFER
jgi:arylsulfatase A-like enzyme/Tfp pilus assembly protein PilF